MESMIDENTVAILVNNPSNPCGSVFDEDHLTEILKIAEVSPKPEISAWLNSEFYSELILHKFTNH